MFWIWIRSQDGTKLICANSIDIKVDTVIDESARSLDTDGMLANPVRKIVGYDIYVNEYMKVAQYKTLDMAKKVLNEIQDKQPKDNIVVYQMPADDIPPTPKNN